MAAKWQQFTKEELQEMANKVKSNASWVKLMGYSSTGGSTSATVQKILDTYPDLDISHFTGQAWNKGNNSYEKLNSTFSGKQETIWRALVAKRGHKCESCGLEVWLEKTIPLEVHHKDGNNQNNDPDNLELLCPNCHAFTDYYRGKNINGTEKVDDEQFAQILKESPNIRQALIALGLTPKGGNYERAYKIIEKYDIEHLKK